MIELTQRERQVLSLVARGLTKREIGQVLFVSENTIKTHMTRLSKKLNVHNRIEMVTTAIRIGLLADDREAEAS